MEPLKNAEIVEKVIDFIERKLKSNNCLAELERVFSENYPTYQLIFKEQMGMNIIDYINKARINEAEKLLEKTTLDIKEVAIAVGINGYFEFTQLFKRMIGVTPSGYRNQLIKSL